MKKLFIITLLLLTVSVFSQEKKENILGKNEFKLNLPALIAGYPEVTYERLLTEETSLGISFGFSINKTNSNDNDSNGNYNFSLIPYYRVYFGDKPHAGFFVDGNAALYSQKAIDGNFFVNKKEGGLGFGLGFDIGKKYKTKKGWVCEVYFGIARTLINTDKLNLIYLRGGIAVGKIF